MIAIAAEANFEPGLEVLLHSLKKHNPDHPPVVLISSTIKSFPGVRKWPFSPSDYSHIPAAPRFRTAWYKLEAFRMDFAPIVTLLDADMLCLGDCSELWDLPAGADIAGVPDEGRRGEMKGGLNSGCLVLGPKVRNFHVWQNIMRHASASRDGGDQGAIARYLSTTSGTKVHHLDPKYNTLKRVFVRNPKRWEAMKNDVRLLHFVGKKPWPTGLPQSGLEKSGGEVGYEELEKLWHKEQREMRRERKNTKSD